MDFLALLNSSINFILYCTMSRQFRETFTQIFVPKQLQRLRCGRVSNGHSDGNGMRLKGGCKSRAGQNGFVEIEDSQGDHIEATMAETQMSQL